jgi:gliding motility-associated-like protein
MYLWTSGTSGTNPALTNISDGVYIVEATDSVGCRKTLNIPVVCTTPTIVITQLVTPNADGKNDTWIIQGINNFPQAKVTVYNRWGNEVYNSAPYNNDWDGKSNSGISLGNDYLPAGTYYYVVDINGDGSDVKSGYLEFQP